MSIDTWQNVAIFSLFLFGVAQWNINRLHQQAWDRNVEAWKLHMQIRHGTTIDRGGG